MDLRAVFSKFSKEDDREFIDYLKKQNKRNDNKSIALFRLLANDKVVLKSIPKQLYGVDNKNAYHALRKRLTDSLINFKAKSLLAKEVSEVMNVTKLFLVGKSLLQQQLFDQGLELLLKAEKKAIEINSYALLNEIYHLMIGFQSEGSLDLDLLIVKSTSNLKVLEEEEKLNNTYAFMKAYYKDPNKRFYKKFDVLLEELYSRFQIADTIKYSYRTVYQLSQIAHSFAIATKDYFSIEDFVLKSYGKIKKLEVKNVNQSYYKLHILYIIANIHFRKKNFDESISIVIEMDEVLAVDKKHKTYFLPLISCLRSLNLNYTNNYKEAKQELLPFFNEGSKYALPAILDIQLCLVVYDFQQGEFKGARKKLARFFHTDSWYEKQVGIEWVIKKSLVEILTFIELDDFDYVSSRVLNFERKFVSFLRETNKERVVVFLQFVKQIYLQGKDPKTEEFNRDLLTKFSWKSPIREDIFEMSFYAWLKAKIENEDIYETTLKLVQMKA